MLSDYNSAIATKLVVTTSWDDGHPLDLRLAELLLKHNLPATFYVPLRTERPTMSPAQIRELSANFEIGGHTLTHCDLNRVSLTVARTEIAGCKADLEQITGRPCLSFCFPRGHFRHQHLAEVRQAGFTLARTVELMSFDRPRPVCGLLLLPTSVQAHATGWPAQLRNGAKRLRLGNLLRALRCRRADWAASVELLLAQFMRFGGDTLGKSIQRTTGKDWNRCLYNSLSCETEPPSRPMAIS